MSGVWFTSDLHVGGHALVAGLRGFGEDTGAHDAELARRWDRVVRPDDQVWVLGDVIGRRGHETAGLAWIAQRPGIKHLIAGNHDDVHPLHSQAYKALPRWLEVFATVQQSATRKIAGQRVLLNHMPYAGEGGDHTEVMRYPEWRFPDIGRWLVHGHTHAKEKQRGRQLHVGADAHDLTPVPLKWIEERISAGVDE